MIWKRTLIIVSIVVVLAVLLGLGIWRRMSFVIEGTRIANVMANGSYISNGLNRYHDEHGQFPPAYVSDASGKPLYSWRVLLLPYIDEDLHREFNYSEPWDSPHNRKLIPRMPSIYGSSLEKEESRAGFTRFVAITGEGTAWPEQGRVTFQSLPETSISGDGSVRSPLFESPITMIYHPLKAVYWTAPDDTHPAQLARDIIQARKDRENLFSRERFICIVNNGSTELIPFPKGEDEILRLFEVELNRDDSPKPEDGPVESLQESGQ